MRAAPVKLTPAGARARRASARRQRGGVLLALAGLAVVCVMAAAWLSSGRAGYLVSAAGFALLLPSYVVQPPLRTAPVGVQSEPRAEAPRAPRWITASAFIGGVLLLIGLVLAFVD